MQRISKQHNIPQFANHLLAYLNGLIREKRGTQTAEYPSLPFTSLDTFYSFKFSREGFTDDIDVRDWVKASPLEGGQFDTVVVLTGDEAESAGLDGTPFAARWI